MALNDDPYLFADALRAPVSREDPTLLTDDGDNVVDCIPDPTPDPEVQLELSQTRAMVEAFIANLSPRARSLAERFAYDDLSQADIARADGVSRAAVFKAMNRLIARGRMELSALRECSLLRA